MKRALIIAVLLSSLAHGQSISPSTPVAVVSGGTQSFTVSGLGSGITWTLNGAGTIGSCAGMTTCTYTAPSHVDPQDYTRGCQATPVNSPYSIRVDSLPVDPDSAIWLNRAATDNPQFTSTYHAIKLFPGKLAFYDNAINNTTPQQLMNFTATANSNNYENTNFPLPNESVLAMESGRSIDAIGTGDRHLFSTNYQTCQEYEIYDIWIDFRTSTFTAGNPTQVTWTQNSIWQPQQNYAVYVHGGTGLWAGANGQWRMTVTGPNSGTLPFNSLSWGAPGATSLSAVPSGCQNCNGGGGQQFNPGSYAQYGGVDAAGMPISALSLKLQEWYARTQAGQQDLGHAIRTTLSNRYLAERQRWPATLSAVSVAGESNNILACTNAATVQCTSQFDLSLWLPCANYTWAVGCQFPVYIFGFTGSWVALNGDQTATAVDTTHFTLNINTTGFGPISGIAYLQNNVFPYGATIRLKASFNVDTFCAPTALTDPCPYAKVFLRTLQRYGLVVADGTTPSDNWDSGLVSNELHPDVIRDAAVLINTSVSIQPIEPLLEVVNRASQIGPNGGSLSNYPYWQQSNVNRTYITVTGSSGTVSNDILLQGATVGTDKERVLIAASNTYQLNTWVNGIQTTTLNYAIDSGITGATVSSSGLVTMPNCTTKARGYVTVTSASDASSLPLYIEVNCLPVSSDTSYRLALGNYTGDYVDASGFTWWGSWSNRGFDSVYEQPGLVYGELLGTWPGYAPCSNDPWTGTDNQLYNRSSSTANDQLIQMVIPPGTYNLTIYGEPGFGGFGSGNLCGNTAGQNVFDLEVQGQVVASSQDGFVLGGNYAYRGWTQTYTAATDAAGNMTVNLRNRNGQSVHGDSVSSLLVTPTTSALTITTASFPNGFVNVPYSALPHATGGTLPYTWSISAGSLPTGLSIISSTGTIHGTPSASGTSSFTLRVDDSASNHATKNLSITINTAPVTWVTTSLPSGQVGTAYSQGLSCTGGTGPYTYALTAGTLPSGLSLSAGTISGTPASGSQGAYSLTFKCTDTLGASAITVPPLLLQITVAGGPVIVTSGFSLPGATLNQPYNYQFTATGGLPLYTWSATGVPPGLTLNPGTGALSGIPTDIGSYTLGVTVTDSLGRSSPTVSLGLLVSGTFSISPPTLPGAIINVLYPTQTLVAIGGDGIYAWTLLSGSLPPGMTFAQSGENATITGTATALGVYSFSVQVRDSNGLSTTQPYTIVVTPPGWYVTGKSTVTGKYQVQ